MINQRFIKTDFLFSQFKKSGYMSVDQNIEGSYTSMLISYLKKVTLVFPAAANRFDCNKITSI